MENVERKLPWVNSMELHDQPHDAKTETKRLSMTQNAKITGDRSLHCEQDTYNTNTTARTQLN